MKKLIAIFVFLGALAWAGAAGATTAEVLQPTSDGVLRVSSLHVGGEGIGGVTYFNGSIVNIGENVPVTIADDLRVDGVITRGFGPVKIADDLLVQGNLTVEGTNNLKVYRVQSQWMDSYGVKATDFLRIPYNKEGPSGPCETGSLFGNVTRGFEVLYLCNEDGEWVTL